MAVGYDAVSESHTGTTGSASQASFSWTHVPAGTPKGILVFVFENANAQSVTSVTYNGVNLKLAPGAAAFDTATEPGSVVAYYLGQAVPSGNQTVVVNRTNNANVMYAVAISVTADYSTELVNHSASAQQENQTPAEISVDDEAAAAGINSMRFAAANYGGNGIPGPGANSTALIGIDFGVRTCGVVRETTAGTGSRPVGFSDASDDWACVLVAIRECPRVTVAGVASTSIVGKSKAKSPASAAGVASNSIVGKAQVRSVTTAAGVATVSAVGGTGFAAVTTGAGVAAVSITGKSNFAGVAAAAGAATVAAVGQSTAAAVVASDGVATGAAVGQAQFKGVVTAAGISTVDFVGDYIFAGSTVDSAGSSTFSAVGRAEFRGVTSAAGVATATLAARSLFNAVAAASGVATAAAVGRSTVGASISSDGSSAVLAVGKAQSSAVAAAAGVATAAAVGRSTATAVVAGAGVATVAVVGDASFVGSVCQSSGMSTADFVSRYSYNVFAPGASQIKFGNDVAGKIYLGATKIYDNGL